jgi:hypothetical protein
VQDKADEDQLAVKKVKREHDQEKSKMVKADLIGEGILCGPILSCDK